MPVLDGIGGTGRLQDGIGGTGAQARNDGVGGTGIVGIVTGFASVCVSGIRVHYDDSTPVTINGEPGTADQLGVGQVVSISARPDKSGYQARAITVQYAVAGPIRRIDPVTGEMDVLGQKVKPAALAITDAQGQAMPMGQLKPGMTVVVSGMRAPDGSILATRVERPAKPVTPQVMGKLEPVAGNLYRIGALTVSLPPGQARPSGLVIAITTPDGATVKHIQEVAQLTGVSRVVMQGIVQMRTGDLVQLEQGPVIRVAPGTTIQGGNRDDLTPGRLVKVSASLKDRDMWQADALELQTVQDLTRRAGSDRPHQKGRSSSDDGGKGSSIDDDRDDDSAHRPETRKDEDGTEKRESSSKDLDRRSESGNSGHDSGKVEIEAGKADISGRSGRSEKVERNEKTEKIEIERPQKVEKIERPERPERIDN